MSGQQLTAPIGVRTPRRFTGLLSVAYAGRHPGDVAGVVNFSGGWWSENWDPNGFNQRQAALAGTGTEAPMLWLYADHDSYYGLLSVRRMFGASGRRWDGNPGRVR